MGGTIRDILLGEASFDVDIAVEGDAIAFARALATTLGGRMTPHEKFGTAIVQYGDDERVDVVTTRTEFYDSPGRSRRSSARGCGRISCAGTSRSTRWRRRSRRRTSGASSTRTVAAPTWRRASSASSTTSRSSTTPRGSSGAIRYEARYGLRLDEHSARLARGCIEMGLVGDLSSARLRDELVALLEDPGAVEGILRLGALGADRAIHPTCGRTTRPRRSSSRALALRDDLGLDVPAWRIGLAVLGRELTSDEAYDWLERLKVRRRDVDRVVGAITVAPRIVERLRGETPRSRRRSSSSRTSYAPDAPLLALAREELPELREYFTRLRDVRPRDRRLRPRGARARRVAARRARSSRSSGGGS